ncbi:MAG: AraC family transcriptional regulator [Anaerocolumna sp.]|jgi:AraC-like DNA-binding protein|nr:AraC family transcriptional regulator [Anaerocolumna sp.]
MDWITRMDSILDYIEEHLIEPIDFDEIAKLACCSSYNFQRVFSFCMEIPLAEYIRNRRLSEAAKELRYSDTTILDIGFKYGYDSHEAFTRAFIRFHGVTPKQVKNANVKPKSYLRAKLSYTKENITINTHPSSYLLDRKSTAEVFSNRAPSPITLNFPVSMWSYMEYLGHNTNTMQTYTLISCFCGDAFNAGLALTEDIGILTALEAFGYKCNIYSTKQRNINYLPETELKKHILEELVVNRRPVIAVNIVDCCFGGVIVGYKDNGDCLLNWNYYPFDFSENPQPIITECFDWYKKTEKVIIISERSNCPFNLKQVYFNCFKMASTYLGSGSSLMTEKFYSEWREKLIENEPLITNDYSVIDPMWCDYAEKRFYAGQFMLQLRAFLPQQENMLNELWNIFGRNINNFMYEYIAKVDLIPGSNCESVNFSKFNDTKVRDDMSEIVINCEKEERLAADIIAKMIKIIN